MYHQKRRKKKEQKRMIITHIHKENNHLTNITSSTPSTHTNKREMKNTNTQIHMIIRKYNHLSQTTISKSKKTTIPATHLHLLFLWIEHVVRGHQNSTSSTFSLHSSPTHLITSFPDKLAQYDHAYFPNRAIKRKDSLPIPES